MYLCRILYFFMDHNYIVLILSVVAGVLLAHFIKKNKKVSELLLVFSGAYLLVITILKTLPALSESHDKSVWIMILVGILIQMVLESLSKGVEHGHVHHHQKLSISIIFGLMMHSFLEGMPITEHNEHAHDTAIAIAIHNVPIAAILFYYLEEILPNKFWAYSIMLLFAFITPLGALVGNYTSLSQYPYHISAMVSGIFLHISTTILFENSSKGHKINYFKIASIILTTILVWNM